MTPGTGLKYESWISYIHTQPFVSADSASMESTNHRLKMLKKKKKKILESPNKAKLEFGIISNLKMNLKYMGGCAQIICKFRGCCLVAKSRLTLRDSMDYSPLGSPVPGISQARILEWVAISFSRGSFQPRDRICVS